MVKLGKKEESLLENFFKKKETKMELHYAVDAKTVRLLVEKGANVNAADVGGYTALHLAVTDRNRERIDKIGSECQC